MPPDASASPRLLPPGPPLPALGPAVPQRRFPLGLRTVARGLLRLFGWRLTGSFPNARSQVLIGAPHTSNWDGLVCLTAVVAIGIRIDVLAKRELFSGPLGWVLRSLGGVPVDRDQPGGIVGMATARLRAPEGAVVAIAPEGTRRPVDGWKSGFHRIASDADAVITVLGIDWGRKRISLHGAFEPSADLDTDLALAGALLDGVEGKHPERAYLPPPAEG